MTAEGLLFQGPRSDWFRTEMDRCLRELAKEGFRLPPGPGRSIVQPLCGSLEPGSDEDFTCDRCRRYFSDGVHPAIVMALPRVFICFGLCDECFEKETAA